MINSTNLLALKTQQTKHLPAEKISTSEIELKPMKSGLLSSYLNNLAMINMPVVQSPQTVAPVNYHNNLRKLLGLTRMIM